VASLAGTCPNIKGLEEDTRAKLRFSIFFLIPRYVTQNKKTQKLRANKELKLLQSVIIGVAVDLDAKGGENYGKF